MRTIAKPPRFAARAPSPPIVKRIPAHAIAAAQLRYAPMARVIVQKHTNPLFHPTGLLKRHRKSSFPVPLACCLRKSGDSSIVVRAIHTLAARTAPTRKGIRHPHESKFAELIELTVSKETATAKSPPTSLDAEAIDVIKPRLLRGAPSSKYATTAMYSPPTENPMTQRRRKRSQPAAAPAWAWVGSKAVPSIVIVMR